MKSFIAKRVISILVNLRYLRFKLLKYKENNKKICNTFYHNFKNITLYIMNNVSLERYYFVLYDGALTLIMSKMALNAFCDKTLHIHLYLHVGLSCLHSDQDSWSLWAGPDPSRADPPAEATTDRSGNHVIVKTSVKLHCLWDNPPLSHLWELRFQEE